MPVSKVTPQPPVPPSDPLKEVIEDLKEYATLYPERLQLDDWLEDWVKYSLVRDEFRKARNGGEQK